MESLESHQDGLSAEFIRNRKNPANGRDCFFSEQSFRRVMGPEPSFEEKLLLQLSRIQTEKQKKKRKDLDKPKDVGIRNEVVTTETTEEETLVNDSAKLDVCHSSPEKLSSNFPNNNAQFEPNTDSIDIPEEQEDKVCSDPVVLDSCHDDNSSVLLIHDDVSEGSVELMISDEVDISQTEKITESPLSKEHSDPEEVASGEDSAKTPSRDVSLCLVMPSLSSDEDDDTENDNTNSFSHPFYNYSADTGTSKASPGTSEIQPVQATSVNTDGESSCKSTSSHERQIYQDSANVLDSSSLPSDQNSHASLQGSTSQADPCVMSWQTIVHNASVVESHVQSVSHTTRHMDNASSAPTSWSESDIPIFSVKEPSPEPAASARCHKKNSVWSMEVSSSTESKKSTGDKSEDNAAAKEAVKEALKFKQSDLTKAEHKMYLKFFNKYVKPYMLGGQPPVFTQRQLHEVTMFEKLQRRVLDEQAEFQNYLHDNAKRNPQAYTYLKKAARHYASSKAHSYHSNKKHVLKFSQDVQSRIPLCHDETESKELKFIQTLLEVGLPPRISLPDIQSGNKPVAIPHNIKKLDSWFPRQSKKIVPGHVHHEPVTFDNNVKSLVMKYNVQVVMSSSVVKCLVDSHGPNFDRAWHIPVNVMEHRSEDGHHKVVYLDKPVFEDNLLTRDYSALFHKYCLRTFVSVPKHKRTKEAVFLQSSNKNRTAVTDDPFDMFSADIDSLETFGAGQDRPSDFLYDEEMEISSLASKEETEQTEVAQTSESLPGDNMNLTGQKDATSQEQISENMQIDVKNCDGEFVISKPGHMTRSKTQTKSTSKVNIVEPPDSLSQSLKSFPHSATEKECVRPNTHKPTDMNTDSESDQQISDPGTKTCQPKKNNLLQPSKKLQTALESYETGISPRRSGRLLHKGVDLQSVNREVRQNAFRNQSSPGKKPLYCTDFNATEMPLIGNEKVVGEGSGTLSDQSNEQNTGTLARDPPMHTRSKRYHHSVLVHNPPCETVMPRTSENADVGNDHGKMHFQDMSNISCKDDNMRSSSLTPLSPPSSPIASHPASPQSHTDLQSSPFRTHCHQSSTVREIPSSPVHDNESQPVPPVVIPLSPEESAIRQKPRSIFATQSHHQLHKLEGQAQTNAGSVKSKLFSPLDSILGPSFGITAGKENQTSPQEDSSLYLPPTEVCSSIVYNMWNIGNTSVMIRSRCQGILKDHKKTRRVYLSPKMEYQTTYGLEQVTVNEMARDWAACYIRPQTNLLRVRINAFTSEIMMYEELETHQILQSSLGFRPEDAFQFLDRLFQQLKSLECGKYLLSHETGSDYCGIHSQRQGASSERPEAEGILSRKKTGLDNIVRWIPIDPTILLPYHIANNRIPATFLPKDFVVTNTKPGGQKRKNTENQKDDGNHSNYQGRNKRKGKRKK